MHKQYSHQSLSFISSVAPLPVGLDCTLMELHRHTSIAPLLASMVSTVVELLASPLFTGHLSLLLPYSFSIFSKFFIFITVHNT